MCSWRETFKYTVHQHSKCKCQYQNVACGCIHGPRVKRSWQEQNEVLQHSRFKVQEGNREHSETSLSFAVTNACVFFKPVGYWTTTLRATTKDWCKHELLVKPQKLTCIWTKLAEKFVTVCWAKRVTKTNGKRLLDLPSSLMLLRRAHPPSVWWKTGTLYLNNNCHCR